MWRSVVGRHLVPALVGLVFAAPLLFMVAGSLRPPGEAPPLGLDLVPGEPTLVNYRRLPEVVPLLGYLANSALVAAVAVPLTVLVASWAGFGIRLLQPRARRVAVLTSVAVLLVPVTAQQRPGLELFEIEDEIFEAEVLYGEGAHRSYVKAQATCQQGSRMLVTVGPAGTDAVPRGRRGLSAGGEPVRPGRGGRRPARRRPHAGLGPRPGRKSR